MTAEEQLDIIAGFIGLPEGLVPDAPVSERVRQTLNALQAQVSRQEQTMIAMESAASAATWRRPAEDDAQYAARVGGFGPEDSTKDELTVACDAIRRTRQVMLDVISGVRLGKGVDLTLHARTRDRYLREQDARRDDAPEAEPGGKVRGYRVELEGAGAWLYAGETVNELFDSLEQVVSLTECRVGDAVTIEVVENTPEALEMMPDFPGF